MPTFTTTDHLSLTPDGPTAAGPSGAEQRVFMRQGDADGACGPYSLLMTLLICGVIDRNAIEFFTQLDRRTNYGKLMTALETHPGLFRNGTSLEQLIDIIEPIFRRQLDYASSNANGVTLRRFVIDHVQDGHPVILGTYFSGGGHWSVAIGAEIDAEGNALRLLLLDPGGQPPAACLWNAVLDLQPSGGRYPYHYWYGGVTGLNSGVSISEALAIWPLG
jgi:hypothetical protein